MKAQFFNRPAADLSKTVFVLDMDYFLLKQGSISVDEVNEWIASAHKNVETTFEAALTDKTKQLFN